MIAHLWESTLFALAAILAIHVFHKGSAWSRHFIAWVAYAKFLIPLSLISKYLAPLLLHQTMSNSAPQAIAPTLQGFTAHLDFSLWFDKVSPNAIEPGNASGAFPWISILAGLWVVTSTFAIARRWSLHLKCQRELARLSHSTDEQWTRLARKIAGNRNLPKLVVDRSNRLSAGLFGLFSRTIVVPQKLDTVFDAADREAFLRHELQHAFKYDNLWLFAQKCIRDVFWFHPLVCWLDRQISWEREMMRDEEVLNETQNNKTYLNCLMKASKIELPKISATSLALNGSPFSRRIKAIATYRPNMWSKAVSCCASLATIALLLSIFIVSTKTLQAEEKDRMTQTDLNTLLDEGIQEAREKMSEGEVKTQPKLFENEKIIFKEVLSLMKTDKVAAEKLLFENLSEDSSAGFYFLAGSLIANKDDTKEALIHFETAIDKFPNFLRALRNAGIMHVQKQNWSEGKKLLLRAYALMEKPDTTTCGLLALCYVNLEEYATSEYYYRQATELDPTIRDWKLGLSKALLNQSKYAEAIVIMESAKVESDSVKPDAS